MLVVCVGTATSVGKTFIGANMLGTLRQAGLTVSARKPVQSFDPGDPEPTDSEVLAGATGEPSIEVCPPHRSYPLAMAPPMAAEALGWAPPSLADIADELSWPKARPDLRWVEAAGGVRSPIASDGDSVGLCYLLKPDLVVLVADAGLGTINAVRLSCSALSGHDVAVILNRFDPADRLHVANRSWLTDRDGFNVLSDPSALSTVLLERSGRAEALRPHAVRDSPR